MNAVRLFHRMPSIHPVHHHYRSALLLTCWYDSSIGNQPTSHLSSSDSLVTRFVTDNATPRRILSAYETLRICKSDDQNEISALKMK